MKSVLLAELAKLKRGPAKAVRWMSRPRIRWSHRPADSCWHRLAGPRSFLLCGLNHGFRLHLYHSRRIDIRLIAFAGPLLYSCYRCSAFASRCSRATGADTQSESGWTRTRQVAN